MSLNLLFLLYKKLVFQKKVTKSKFVTKFTVTKSEVDCIMVKVVSRADADYFQLLNFDNNDINKYFDKILFLKEKILFQINC